MNHNPLDAFPYLQQMQEQFRKLFGDDFVRNLMNAMQLPDWAQTPFAAPGGALTGQGAPRPGTRARSDASRASGSDGRAGTNQSPAAPAGGPAGPLGWLHSMNWNPFAGFPPSVEAAPVHPRADMYETRHEVVLVLELPGLEKASDIRISVYPDRVTVRGDVRRRYSPPDGAGMVLSERVAGPFERTFTLPARVRKQHAKAVYSGGLLEIRLLKEGRAGEGEGSLIDVDFM